MLIFVIDYVLTYHNRSKRGPVTLRQGHGIVTLRQKALHIHCSFQMAYYLLINVIQYH